MTKSKIIVCALIFSFVGIFQNIFGMDFVRGLFKKKESSISEYNFFKDIMGISEAAFKKEVASGKVAKYLKVGADNNILKTSQGTFLCGKFYELNVGNLITESKKVLQKNKPGGGRFSVYQGSKKGWSGYGLDVRALQADPKHSGAAFEIASNYNALETVAADQDIDKQLLSSYPNDPTQGPAASVSAAPGVIFRKYFMYHDRFPKDPKKWEQKNPASIGQKGLEWPGSYYLNYPDIAKCQINLLKNLTKKGPLGMSLGGYVLLPHSIAPGHNDFKKVNIGYHAGIQVIYGGKENGKVSKVTQPVLIDQIFTAAVDWPGTNGHLQTNKNAQDWGDAIIKASREGNLRAAFLESLKKRKKNLPGKNKIFLTIVGGGVFAGKLQGHIFKFHFTELFRLKKFIRDSGLHVIFVSYGSFKDVVKKALASLKTQKEKSEFKKNLKDLLSAGQHRQYSDHKKYKSIKIDQLVG